MTLYNQTGDNVILYGAGVSLIKKVAELSASLLQDSDVIGHT